MWDGIIVCTPRGSVRQHRTGGARRGYKTGAPGSDAALASTARCENQLLLQGGWLQVRGRRWTQQGQRWQRPRWAILMGPVKTRSRA